MKSLKHRRQSVVSQAFLLCTIACAFFISNTMFATATTTATTTATSAATSSTVSSIAPLALSVPTTNATSNTEEVEVTQSDCGSITAPKDWPNHGRSDDTLETTEIVDCDNPFGLSTDLPIPYRLNVEGSRYDTGATIATFDGTMSLPIRYSGYPSYDGVGTFLFKHEGEDYVYVNQEQEWRETEFTQAEVLAYAGSHFSTQTAANLYTDIYFSDDQLDYFIDENGNPIIDSGTGEEVSDRFDDFERFLEEQRVISPEPISSGTYTLVFDEYELILTSQSFWQKFARHIVPIAHAQENPQVRRFAITFTLTEAGSGCEGVCASNVLFLPGIQASRLYTSTEKVWEPGSNADVRQLEMTNTGESVNQIHTRDVIDHIPVNGTVYADFLSYLDELVEQDVINEWDTYAYDWRYNVFDVAREGTQYETYVRKLAQALKAISLTSKNGKVTLVAHSNGGLLAKALLIEYPGAAEVIDEIILVGSPQLGTPQAVATVLHGYKQDILKGLVVGDVVARDVISNMPGAYGLLPSQAYFDATNDLVVYFDASETTAFFRNAYGNAINDADELEQFMLGEADGRAHAGDATHKASKANVDLLAEASMYHETLLAPWRAPTGVSVTEIVGVGLDTESGFTYQEFNERVCRFLLYCDRLQLYKPVPRFTQYGDGTVVGASAEGYQGEKETYYINLESIREVTRENIKHSNLTESDSVQQLILQLLVRDRIENAPFVSTKLPSNIESNRTLLGVHSPVSIYIEDIEGRVVGKKEGEILEEIPGSSYRELGGSKYVIVPAGVDYTVFIAGEADGGMTFTVAELEGEQQTEIINVEVATITASTTITIKKNGDNFSPLSVDEDGDGYIDIAIRPDGTVSVSEPELPTVTQSSGGTSATRTERWRVEDSPRVLGTQMSVYQTANMSDAEIRTLLEAVKQRLVALGEM